MATVEAVPDSATRTIQADPLEAGRVADAGKDPGATRRRLIIGVTGHRHNHFDEEGLARLAAEFRSVLEAVTRHFSSVDEFKLVTGLASGADSIAADIALDLGWTLEAVLPSLRERYALDFAAGDERAGFLRRLEAASAVFELPCADSPVDASHYERAGRVMLDQCDLLLAGWDGEPARGRGGTEQMVSEAVCRHIPVLHVDTTGHRPPAILWSGFDPHGLARTEVTAVGRVPLDRLAELEIAGPAEQPPTPRPGGLRRDLVGRAIASIYPVFLALMGVRPLRVADFRSIDPARAREAMTAATARVCASTGRFGERLHAILVPRHAIADAEATQMGQIYRSGFVANFSLSALAVMLALAGLLVPVGLKSLLTVGEVTVVSSILWLTHVGRSRGWHGRWIEQRHLAERLRCLALAAQLGDLALSFGGLKTRADRELRDTARALGLPSVRVDAGYLNCVRDGLAAMLEDQIAYNEANARRMHRLDHRLHRIGTLLFSLGAVICLSVLLLDIGVHASGSEWLEAVSPRVTLATAVLSAVLPAIGAAIYGIRMQGDFAGVATRSQVLAQALAPLRDGIGPGQEAADDHAFDQLRQFGRRATELMNAELADWRNAHSARPLTLPG